MKCFQRMLDKITSLKEHDQMQRFVSPLKDYFGINHFWYYKITFSGNYSYVGTHNAWNEFCFDQDLLSFFPCLRHPNILTPGINLMKASEDLEYNKVLDTVWNRFQINFHLNLINRTSNGIEAFGFASQFNDPQADQRLLNELPLLTQFTKLFRKKNPKIFQTIEESSIHLPTVFGAKYFEAPKMISLSKNRKNLLKELDFGYILTLTPRERDVLRYLSKGFSAGYIAQELKLHTRTVENYLATLKSKLFCQSKTELIHKANEISSLDSYLY